MTGSHFGSYGTTGTILMEMTYGLVGGKVIVIIIIITQSNLFLEDRIWDNSIQFRDKNLHGIESEDKKS